MRNCERFSFFFPDSWCSSVSMSPVYLSTGFRSGCSQALLLFIGLFHKALLKACLTLARPSMSLLRFIGLFSRSFESIPHPCSPLHVSFVLHRALLRFIGLFYKVFQQHTSLLLTLALQLVLLLALQHWHRALVHPQDRRYCPRRSVWRIRLSGL